MDNQDILDLIPGNWFVLIDESEYQAEQQEITDDIVDLFGWYFGVDAPSLENVTIELANKLNQPFSVTRIQLKFLVEYRTKTFLFDRHYGHLFPRDETDRLILTPAAMAKVHNTTEVEVSGFLNDNREILSSADLLQSWPSADSDSEN